MSSFSQIQVIWNKFQVVNENLKDIPFCLFGFLHFLRSAMPYEFVMYIRLFLMTKVGSYCGNWLFTVAIARKYTHAHIQVYISFKHENGMNETTLSSDA